MPNWVNNDITIKGHPRTIQRFVKAVKSSESVFDFNNIIPCPEELKNDDWQRDKAVAAANKAKHGHEGWYDWNVENWGTKWNSCEARVMNSDKDKHTIYYTFDTAWSPVGDKVMYLLSRRFPSLTIIHEFHEEAGMYPSERCTWKDGIKSSEEIANTLCDTGEDEE